MPIYEVNMTYEPFSNEPEYIEANRAFVADMDFSNVRHLLDLACGTGLMTELATDVRADMHVVGVDRSAESLELARERFDRLAKERGRPLDVRVECASADAIPLDDASVDAVIMGNAIHMLPDRDALLAEVARVLRPGGWFAFNSSFYAGTFAPGTEKFYHDWIKLALQAVMEKDRRLKAGGRPGIPRQRGRAAPAFSNPWLSPSQWARAAGDHGLDVTRENERTVVMTEHSFQTIGAYGGFAEVMLSGYPVDESSYALQATAGAGMRENHLEVVPRLWLEMIAARRANSP